MKLYREAYLMHHGILGQKWGKRNGPPYPLGASDHSASEKKAEWKKSLDSKSNDAAKRDSGSDSRPATKRRFTDNEKKKMRAVVLGSVASLGIAAGLYAAYKTNAIEYIYKTIKYGNPDKKTIREMMADILHQDTMILRKGTKIHRIEGAGGIDITQSGNAAYAAYKKRDVAAYMTMLTDWTKKGQQHDVTYEAIRDLRVPTKEKAKQIFSQLFDEDSSFREELRRDIADAISERYHLPRHMLDDPDDFKSIADDYLGDSAFDQAMFSVFKQGSSTKKMMERFIQNGFDAIEDYHDKGLMAESPLILLNPSSSVVKKGEAFVDTALKKKTLRGLLLSGTRTLLVTDTSTGKKLKVSKALKMLSETN